MSTRNGHRVRVILCEGRGSELLADRERFDVVSRLLDRGYSVTRSNGTDHVYEDDGSSLVMLGRFTETPPLAFPGIGDRRSVAFCDMAGLDSASIPDAVERAVADSGGESPGGWKPWFPVIDYDRCTHCMQCLSFCLFDVYAVNDKEQITVQNQDKCKTDCPACSRVCPEVAILFPKYGKGPINGDIVRDVDIQREAMKVDVSALLGGDIYAALRTRQSEARKRFSTERDESRALLERRRCLKKIQGELDIPDEVLMSLPSVGDIRERAERAKAKAARRQARSVTVSDRRPAPSQEEWGI